MEGLMNPLARRDATPQEAELPPPTGTVFLLTRYVAVIAGVWGAMYLIMISR
jgi:hypothetical protein